MLKKYKQPILLLSIGLICVLFALINFSKTYDIPFFKGYKHVVEEKIKLEQKNNKNEMLQVKEVSAQKKLNDMDKVIVQNEKEMEKVKDDVDGLESRLLNEGKGTLHIPSLLIELEQKAKEQGIRISFNIQELTGNATTETNDISPKEVMVNVKFNGQYQSIIQYVTELELNNSFITVKALDFERKDDIIDGIFTISITYFGG